mgnify:CR=1 FL=1
MNPRREHRLVFLLSVAQRRLQRWMAARTQHSGVTAAQSGLLFILGQRDGVLMGEAGAALDLGPPGISGLVDRMTAANLIRRRADPDDGRAWRLWLTPAGRTALAQSKAGSSRSTRASPKDSAKPRSMSSRAGSTSLQTRFPRGEDE